MQSESQDQRRIIFPKTLHTMPGKRKAVTEPREVSNSEVELITSASELLKVTEVELEEPEPKKSPYENQKGKNTAAKVQPLQFLISSMCKTCSFQSQRAPN